MAAGRGGMAVALVTAIGFGAAPAVAPWTESAREPVCSNPGAPDFVSLASSVRGAVVSITATSRDEGEAFTPSARGAFERHFGAREPPMKGMASGFLIRADGYLLTNQHVVEGAETLAVALADDEDRSYPATVVGVDAPSDLALLKIEAGRPLPALGLGDSDGLAAGEWVAAIGNPFGLAHSFSVGVVSSLGRRDIHPGGRPGYDDFIQTDASINPGSSGGPLVDRHGRVVGISAAVNPGGQGIGFAIPVNMAKDVLPALYERGFVERSWMGASVQDLSVALAASFGIASGVVVTEVVPEGPAAKAGILPGDVITAFDETPVDRSHRLRWLASTAGVGHSATMEVASAGRRRTVSIELARLPGVVSPFSRTEPQASRPTLGPAGFRLGGTLVGGPSGQGLRVVEVDPTSPAFISGVRVGDVVLAVDDHTVHRPEDLAGFLVPAKVGRLFVRRGLKPMFIGVSRGP